MLAMGSALFFPLLLQASCLSLFFQSSWALSTCSCVHGLKKQDDDDGDGGTGRMHNYNNNNNNDDTKMKEYEGKNEKR